MKETEIKFVYKKGPDWFLSQCEPESIASVILKHDHDAVMFMSDTGFEEIAGRMSLNKETT